MFRRIVVEAESVDQAIRKIQSEAPAGYELLLTEVLSEPKADTIRSLAPTTEGAFGRARHKVPKGADVIEETELRKAGSETLTVEAPDEANARVQVEQRMDEGTKLQFLKLETPGSSGFLGIGKKPNRYRAQLFHPAIVRISYRLTARVSATLMSAEAADQARTAARELIEAYDQGGLPSPGTGVKETMRHIGQSLESVGGFDLMLATHTLFSEQRPRAKRILEQAWDGIGAWIG